MGSVESIQSPQNNNDSTVVLHLTTNKVMLKTNLTMNNESVEFIIDTGFTGSSIINSFSNSDIVGGKGCRFDRQNCFELVSLGETKKHCAKEYICDTQFNNDPFVLMNMGSDIPNIITLDFLLKRGDLITFNLPAYKIEIQNRPLKTANDSSIIRRVPLQKIHDAFVIHVKINGITARCIVDTGSSLTLSLCKDWVDAHEQQIDLWQVDDLLRQQGVNGELIKSNKTVKLPIKISNSDQDLVWHSNVYLNDTAIQDENIDGYLGLETMWQAFGGVFIIENDDVTPNLCFYQS